MVTEGWESHNGTKQYVFLKSVNGQYVLEDNSTLFLRCYDCNCSLSASDGNVFGNVLLIILGFSFVLFLADLVFVNLFNRCMKAHSEFIVCCQSRRHLSLLSYNAFIIRCPFRFCSSASCKVLLVNT